MTMTIDISPEMEARFEAEAEQSLLLDWQALCYQSLWEVLDNEDDTVYDAL